MTKELNSTGRVRQIKLSLPIVQTDSYEIHCTIPSPQARSSSTLRPVTRQRPPIDINKYIHNWNDRTTRIRSLVHLNCLTGPVLVDSCVGMASIPTDSSSTMTDTISNALIDSGYSGQTLRTLSKMAKENRNQNRTIDDERSQLLYTDKLVYKSIGSFGNFRMNKRKNGMWQNVHHPQLTTVKALHKRKVSQPKSNQSNVDLKVPDTITLERLPQQSLVSESVRLHEQIERLTKTYFPTIQHLRHGYLYSELVNNRMHLDGEDKKDFFPAIFRSRAVR